MFVVVPPHVGKSLGFIAIFGNLLLFGIGLPLYWMYVLSEQSGGYWFVGAIVAFGVVLAPKVPTAARLLSLVLLLLCGGFGFAAERHARTQAATAALRSRVGDMEFDMRQRAAGSNGSQADPFRQRPTDKTMDVYAQLVMAAVSNAGKSQTPTTMLLASLACRNLVVLDMAIADLVGPNGLGLDEGVWEGWATPELAHLIQHSRSKLPHGTVIDACERLLGF